MATQYEIAIIQHCVLPGSLATIVREDLPDDILPTESLRPLWHFAINYWHSVGTEGTAPSPGAMRTHFEAELAEHEIDLDIEPEDDLPWALEALKGAYVDRQWQSWVRKFAGEMSEANLLAKQDSLSSAIGDLMAIQTRLASPYEHVDVRSAAARMFEAYEARVAMRSSGEIDGLVTGFDPVDQHTFGIRDGEVCVLAAPPKTGKSFFLLHSALSLWQAGKVPVLFSLENSVEMTMDRLACMALHINARRWQRGEATADEVRLVREWIALLRDHERPFHILQPETGKRTIQHMVRRARMLGDAVFVDQLTFVEPEAADERKPRYQQVGSSMHLLKAMVSSGSSRMAAMLAHQINREGVKAAERAGRLEMYHLAEAAEVERTSDWVLGLWQSRSMRELNRCYLQTLASRREDIENWEMHWEPWVGHMRVVNTVVLEDAA